MTGASKAAETVAMVAVAMAAAMATARMVVAMAAMAAAATMVEVERVLQGPQLQWRAVRPHSE